MSDRTSRWALAEDGDGWWHAAPVHPAAGPGARMRVRDPAEAVRAAPPGTRWVWRSTAEVYPRLLAAGVRVERCYDIEDAELLLLGHEGRLGEPRSAAAALGPAARRPRTARSAAARRRARRAVLRSSSRSRRPVPLDALLEVYADQQRRHDATEHPDRMRLLTAAESAGMLVAAEMNRAGLPWRADVHRELLHELLGERYAGGGEPRRLAELADEVSAAFGRRVRPDLPADVVKAFARGRDQGQVDPPLGDRGARPPGREAADRVQEAVPDLDRARLELARRTGCATAASGPSSSRAAPSPAAGSTNGGGRPADPQGDPAGRGRRPRLAARRRRRRPDGAARAGRDLPRPGPDGGGRPARATSTSPSPTAPSPATATRPSSPCSARSTARPPATA